MRSFGTQSIERALRLLDRILEADGSTTLATIAVECNLSVSTAYRLAAALERAGYVIAVGRGRYLAGPAVVARSANLSLQPALVALARPIVKRLARATRSTAHLGVLDDHMVTYLVKSGPVKSKTHDDGIFTREGKQLEAYCSGIGKVLLASLGQAEREAYLANGPFIALTPNTITDSARLAEELRTVARQGFACDDEEIAPGLRCLAVPLRDPAGATIAALSASRLRGGRPGLPDAQVLAKLAASARELETKLFAAATPDAADEV